MPYFTIIDPKSGPILWRESDTTIGVLQPRDEHTPLSMALVVKWWDEVGRALWRLIVHGDAVPGLRVVVGRKFRPAR